MSNYYIQCNCGLKDVRQENWLLVVRAVTSKVIWVLVMGVFVHQGPSLSLVFAHSLDSSWISIVVYKY